MLAMAVASLAQLCSAHKLETVIAVVSAEKFFQNVAQRELLRS
jgi:Skp family chaperone for outer membrane proteins